jgi:4-coumarate--CoA ligase
VGAYKEGEICFKGPLLMKGYVGDPVATANTIDKDGWLHTGDVAYYDEDEYFYIVDRIKELIKYKAFQVAPAELEALLVTHPAVADAAVIGLPDEAAGELPLAYVVKKPGKTATEKELEKFIAGRENPCCVHSINSFLQRTSLRRSGSEEELFSWTKYPGTRLEKFSGGT